MIKPNQELGIFFEFVAQFYTKRNLNLQLIRLFQHKQLPLENEIESILLYVNESFSLNCFDKQFTLRLFLVFYEIIKRLVTTR